MSIASTDFALSLLKTASSPTGSYVLSPFSMGSALAMVHDGARGETQKELTQLLHKGGSADNVTEHYSKLSSSLTTATDVKTSVANRFFLAQGFKLKDDYKEHVEKKYKAGVEQVNMKDTATSANKMNSFVNEKTEGMIPKLIEPPHVSGAVAVLINAVYFKGKWKMEFNTDNTKDETFHGAKGDRQEPFMYGRKFDVQYNFSDDFQAVSLPYKDAGYSLLVVMPRDFTEWRQKLTGEKLYEIMNGLSKSKVNIEMPKFKIETALDGGETLQKLGVTRIFGSEADLTGISDSDDLQVSKVIHKAVIDVSEEGTKAAAATAVVMARCMRPMIPEIIPTFRADRPFLYALVHEQSNVLFVGQFA